MVPLMKNLSCIYLFIIFFMCSTYSMDQKSDRASVAPTLITEKSRNVSPKAIQKTASSFHSPIQLTVSPIPALPSSEDARIKHTCEVRISCCEKIMKCSHLFLLAAAVATGVALGYYVAKLSNTCSELIVPVSQIRDDVSQIRDYASQGVVLMRQGITLGQSAIELANKTVGDIQAEGLQLRDIINTTQKTCLDAHAMCQSAQSSCENPLGTLP